MSIRSGKSAVLPLFFIIFLSVHLLGAQVASAAALQMSNTAQAYWKRALKYDWTAMRIPVGPIPPIARNQTKEIRYAISAKREFVEQFETRGATGEVCVVNSGTAPIESLTVVTQIQFKAPGAEDWELIPGAEQSLPVDARLEPNETRCISYDLKMDALAGGPARDHEYRSLAIALDSSGNEQSSRMEASTTLALPAKPAVQEIDEKAALVNVIFCPDGFSCSVADTSWTLLESGDIDILVQMTNNSIDCGKLVELGNELVLTETDSLIERRESSEVAVPTGICETQVF